RPVVAGRRTLGQLPFEVRAALFDAAQFGEPLFQDRAGLPQLGQFGRQGARFAQASLRPFDVLPLLLDLAQVLLALFLEFLGDPAALALRLRLLVFDRFALALQIGQLLLHPLPLPRQLFDVGLVFAALFADAPLVEPQLRLGGFELVARLHNRGLFFGRRAPAAGEFLAGLRQLTGEFRLDLAEPAAVVAGEVVRPLALRGQRAGELFAPAAFVDARRRRIFHGS